MRHLIFFCIAILMLASCEKEQQPGPETPQDAKKDTVIKNLSYGSDPAQKMDLYLPAARTDTTRVIILIHGGGWNTGDKGELSFFAEGWKKRGFAVANINYRLSPKTDDNYKMQLDDIGSSIQFLLNNANSYAYSKISFYMTGHSAGGHLSLAYSYTRNESRLIKAVAGMAAPTDLFRLAYYDPNVYAPLLTPYLGVALTSASEARYKNASPYYQVNESSVPTILFHGDLDFIVNKDHSTYLDAKLDKVGVDHRLKIYPAQFHDWWTNGDFVKNTLDETAAWFRKF